MKKFTAFLLTAFLVTTIVAGLSTVKETRDVNGFTKISYGISGNLSIKIGSEFSVVLEGEKDDLREVITDISDAGLPYCKAESLCFTLVSSAQQGNIKFIFQEFDKIFRMRGFSCPSHGDITNTDDRNVKLVGFQDPGIIQEVPEV